MSRASKRLESLRDRARMFNAVRAFFAERSVLEVDTPVMSQAAPVDTHIDILSTKLSDQRLGYFHSSPEYAMKRLLSQGIGDIYQMSHVFRDGEIGKLHNPEFTMIEWYRVGFTYERMIEETLDLIRLFLGDLPAQYISYREALLRYAGVDYLNASLDALVAAAERTQIELPSDIQSWDQDTLLNFLISFAVEPNLQQLTVLKDYPSSQAALARTSVREGEHIAERFEVYYRGVELANGFHELTDEQEQRRRFENDNTKRIYMGKEPLPIDEYFLAALKQGLPDCCGVAVGFDRLMLLRQGSETLQEVLPFAWGDA